MKNCICFVKNHSWSLPELKLGWVDMKASLVKSSMDLSNSFCPRPQTIIFEYQKIIIEFDNLPPEVLKEILARLVTKPQCLTRGCIAAWRDEYCSTLKFRKVCKRWMNFIDEVLEATVLSLLGIWIPNRLLLEVLPRSIMVLRVLEGRNTAMFSDLNYFPGKSVVFSEFFSAYKHYDESIYSNHMIFRFGHLLSVLCFSNLKLHINGLRNILKASKNLKVLALNCVSLCFNGHFDLTSMPALKKLKTIVVGDKCTVSTSEVNKYDQTDFKNTGQTDQWLFNTYADQVENLEIVVYSRVKTTQLTQLKQLSLNTLSLFYLHEIGEAVKLERLNVSRYGESTNQDFGTMYDLFKIVDQVTNNLKELYVDISWLEFERIKSTSNCHYQEMKKIQLSRQLQFLRVHKLTINYPQYEDDETMLLEFVLQKFPRLINLVLIRYVMYCPPVPFYYPHQVTVLHEPPPVVNGVWGICKILEKVSITTRVYNANEREYDYIQTNFKRPNV